MKLVSLARVARRVLSGAVIAVVSLNGLAVTGSLFFSQPAYAATADVYVASTGSDSSNDCSSVLSPCQTIAYALTQVNSGGNVHVDGGTYPENLVISQPVNLIGPNANTNANGSRASEATIDGGSGFAITLGAADVTINGFTITANSGGEGIYNIDARTPGHDISGVAITNNIFSGSSRAIALESNATGTVNVSDNRFDSNDKDLAVADNSFGDLEVEGNTFNEPATNDTSVQIGPDGTGTINSFEFEGNTVYGNVNIGANVDGATVSGNTFNYGSASGGSLEFQAALHSSSVVSNNTFNGNSSYACLQLFGSQYGLTASDGVTISGNTFSDCGDGTSPYYNYAIQLSQDVSNITISGNTITNAYDGINTRFFSGPVWTLNSSITISSNKITASRHLTINNTVDGTLVADGNWWGSALGPETTDYSSGVSVSSWCSVADCSTTQSASSGTTPLPSGPIATPTVSGSTSSVTLPNTNDVTASTTTPSGTVAVTIPKGVTITADSAAWDGTIAPPTVLSNSSVTNLPAGATASSVISIGSSSVSLTFDHSVQLLFAGQAGKSIGFVRNGNFTQISTVCTANSQTAVDAQLGTGGDCYIDVGSDLIVWTKHFTVFATYTPKAVVATKSNTYTVQAGDTFYSIAQKVGLTLAQLEALNPNAGHPAGNFSFILPGDILDIGSAVVFASTTGESTTPATTPVITNPTTPANSKVAKTPAAAVAVKASTGLKWYWWIVIGAAAAAAVAGYGFYGLKANPPKRSRR